MTTQIPNSMLLTPGGVSDAVARAQATAAQTTADSKATLQSGPLAASTTSAPNATAVITAIAAGTGGASITLRTAASNAIPLDTVGNGRAMPLVAGQTILINVPTMLTIAAGAIEGASCEATYYVASTLALPTTYPGIPVGAAVIVNGTISVGFRYRLVFGISAGDLVIFCFQQATVDAVAPTLLSASVASATPAQIDLVFNKAMFATWSAATAFVIAGHPINSITRLTATTGFLTSSTAFVNGESARTLSYIQPGTNNMQDLAGNLLVNIVAAAITNNAATPAPIFVSATPSAATVGTPYSYTYAATNATSYPLVSGTFPAGLTYNPANGNISGTPTTVSAVVHMVSAVGPGGTTNGPSNTLTVNAASVVLALDSVTPAALGAYSLNRKLRSAYVGSACIIRSSAGGNITVGFSGNTVDWPTAMTALGANNAFLVTVFDQSANGRDATQAAVGQQPQIATAGVVNKQASLYPASIGNSAVNTGLVTAGFTLGATLGGATIYVAAGLLTNAGAFGTAALLAGADVNDYDSPNSLYVANNGLILSSYFGTFTGATATVASAATIVTCSRYLTSNPGELWVNGVAGAVGSGGTGNVGTAGAGNKLSFHSRLQGGGAAQPTAGNVMEVIYFPRLVDVDRLTVETNLRAAYGV